MNKEKLVIFDWGGVIESHKDGEYSYKIIYKNILKRIGVKEIPKDFLEKIYSCNYDENGVHIFAEDNNDKLNEYIKRIYNAFNLNCSKEDIISFKQIYLDEFNKTYYYKDVSNIIKDISNYCYVGVLSNLILLDEYRIRRQIDFNDLDFIWLSFKMRMHKPKEEIFLKVLDECKFNPKDILFLDDSIDNLKIAHKLGFKTYLVNGYDFNNIKKTIDDFLKN